MRRSRTVRRPATRLVRGGRHSAWGATGGDSWCSREACSSSLLWYRGRFGGGWLVAGGGRIACALRFGLATKAPRQHHVAAAPIGRDQQRRDRAPESEPA